MKRCKTIIGVFVLASAATMSTAAAGRSPSTTPTTQPTTVPTPDRKASELTRGDRMTSPAVTWPVPSIPATAKPHRRAQFGAHPLIQAPDVFDPFIGTPNVAAGSRVRF